MATISTAITTMELSKHVYVFNWPNQSSHPNLIENLLQDLKTNVTRCFPSTLSETELFWNIKWHNLCLWLHKFGRNPPKHLQLQLQQMLFCHDLTQESWLQRHNRLFRFTLAYFFNTINHFHFIAQFCTTLYLSVLWSSSWCLLLLPNIAFKNVRDMDIFPTR